MARLGPHHSPLPQVPIVASHLQHEIGDTVKQMLVYLQSGADGRNQTVRNSQIRGLGWPLHATELRH